MSPVRYHALCETFRRGDSAAVMQMLQLREELRHAGHEEPLRAACWFGMEDVARALVEEWGAAVDGDLPEIARRRGHGTLAVWLGDTLLSLQRLIA
jgi:hypothetical protein